MEAKYSPTTKQLLNNGCRWNHGVDRVAMRPDGYAYCRGCNGDQQVLARARKILPWLPKPEEFKQTYGVEAVERIRYVLRKFPSQKTGQTQQLSTPLMDRITFERYTENE